MLYIVLDDAALIVMPSTANVFAIDAVIALLAVLYVELSDADDCCIVAIRIHVLLNMLM